MVGTVSVGPKWGGGGSGVRGRGVGQTDTEKRLFCGRGCASLRRGVQERDGGLDRG